MRCVPRKEHGSAKMLRSRCIWGRIFELNIFSGFPLPPHIYWVLIPTFSFEIFLENFPLKIYIEKILQTAHYIGVVSPKQISSICFGKVYVKTVLCRAGLKRLVAITYKNLGDTTFCLGGLLSRPKDLPKEASPSKKPCRRPPASGHKTYILLLLRMHI